MINSDYIESVTEESYSKFINRCTYIHMHTIPDSLFFINNDIKFAIYHTLNDDPLIALTSSTDESLTLPEYLKQFAYVHSISNFRRSPSSNVIYYNTDDLYTFVVRGVLRSELDTLAA